jgi:hypothetical protein
MGVVITLQSMHVLCLVYTRFSTPLECPCLICPRNRNPEPEILDGCAQTRNRKPLALARIPPYPAEKAAPPLQRSAGSRARLQGTLEAFGLQTECVGPRVDGTGTGRLIVELLQ